MAIACAGSLTERGCVDEQEQDPKYYDWAHEIEGNPVIQRFAALARELRVVRCNALRVGSTRNSGSRGS